MSHHNPIERYKEFCRWRWPKAIYSTAGHHRPNCGKGKEKGKGKITSKRNFFEKIKEK